MHTTVQRTLILVPMLLATGCATNPPTATPTPSAPSTGTPVATASRVPSTPLPTATPSASATLPTTLPSPSSSPSAPRPGQAAPAGYAQSCAKDVPWGVQVSKPFICLDGPPAGTRVVRGSSIIVTGYAGGSFESNVVTEVRALIDREPGIRLANVPSTYSAPDVGMPGAWRVTLGIPASAPVGAARVIAHFDSPRDGSVVAQAMVDIVIE